ncbi:MAG: CoA-binding protein [Planctomycetes bacterium]|nr:CoA-binding protein [Planctomycetota bacterium]
MSDVTASIVEETAQLGIKHIWMQPGAESEEAVKRAEQLGMNVIAGGPCALVRLRYHEDEVRDPGKLIRRVKSLASTELSFCKKPRRDWGRTRLTPAISSKGINHDDP